MHDAFKNSSHKLDVGCPKTMLIKIVISNKSFIHSPGKEKAKTSKLSFGRIGESAGDISGPGIIDKT